MSLPQRQRAWQTGVVSLADAARPWPLADRLAEMYSTRERRCHWCGEAYPSGTGPFPGVCTSACAEAAGVKA